MRRINNSVEKFESYITIKNSINGISTVNIEKALDSQLAAAKKNNTIKNEMLSYNTTISKQTDMLILGGDAWI